MSLKKPTLPPKIGKNRKFRFMLKNNGRFQELIFAKLFHLPVFLAINRNFFLKNNSEKLMRFSVKKHGRFIFFEILKLFKMTAKNNKKEKFCFSSKKAVRFYFSIFSKLFNLPGVFNKNRRNFFVSSFEKLFRFLVKIADRFKTLNFSEEINLSAKKRKKENFLFLPKNDGRFYFFVFSKYFNLSSENRRNRRNFICLSFKKLFQFMVNFPRRFIFLNFLRFENLTERLTINPFLCFIAKNGERL